MSEFQQELAVVCFGCLCLVLCIRKACYFLLLRGSHNRLTWALGLDVLGECVALGFTLAFSVLAFTDVLHSMPSWVSSIMRVCMYATVTGTTLYLAYNIRQIQLGEDDA